MSAQTVLITGLNGYTAPHIAHQFLNKGWNVRGTVRSDSKKEKVLNLSAFKNWVDQGKVEVVIVEDFLTSDYTEALNGVDAVVLAASPFNMTLSTYEEFATPAIQGTKRVLEAAAKVSSIKAIAYVSSGVSILDVFQPLDSYGGRLVTEKDWLESTEEDAKKESDSPTKKALWYAVSKKYAELAARETKKETGASYALSSYCPTVVYGPVQETDDLKDLQHAPGSDLSASALYHLLVGGENAPLLPEHHVQYLDVRDLASAIYAGVDKKSEGRFITAGYEFFYQDFVNIARRLRPDLSKFIVKGDSNGSTSPPVGSYRFDRSASEKELGIKYHTLEETVRDTIARFEEMGAYKA
ncbi:uncharacterized protein L201_001771 [Kwoniella dendrophila CBS 6074]|uniref:NAD-dependent epimerase/dehydratase domain-containing protein n=1 Tax=Kwoniella dendrophila CBS 6074 TaxID=1295534 RepID=A0AAX4JPY3_9TREE